MENEFFRDLFCFQCSLQFNGKYVYDLHQLLVHGSKDIEKSVGSEVKMEINSEISESRNKKKTSTLLILPQVHEEKKDVF